MAVTLFVSWLAVGIVALPAEAQPPGRPHPGPAPATKPLPAATPSLAPGTRAISPPKLPTLSPKPAKKPKPPAGPVLPLPRLRVSVWGGQGAASLRQVSGDVGGAPAKTGLSLGLEAGLVLVRKVMIETSRGKPRDIWIGARLGLLSPGEVTGSLGTVTTSLRTAQFGGWFQGGSFEAWHGRVSFFAGPSFGEAEIRPLAGPSRDWSGSSWTYDASIRLGRTIGQPLAVFLDVGYHWARIKDVKEGGKPALRQNGLEPLLDFSGASLHLGLSYTLKRSAPPAKKDKKGKKAK